MTHPAFGRFETFSNKGKRLRRLMPITFSLPLILLGFYSTPPPVGLMYRKLATQTMVAKPQLGLVKALLLPKPHSDPALLGARDFVRWGQGHVLICKIKSLCGYSTIVRVELQYYSTYAHSCGH